MNQVRRHLIAALTAVILFLLFLPLFEYYFHYQTPLPRYCPHESFNLKGGLPWQQQ